MNIDSHNGKAGNRRQKVAYRQESLHSSTYSHHQVGKMYDSCMHACVYVHGVVFFSYIKLWHLLYYRAFKNLNIGSKM